MEKKMSFKPSADVCPVAIDFYVEDGILKDVKFQGGCSGNQQGIASLVKGMKVEDVIQKLSGIRCGRKSSSCPDQLAQALKEME